MSQHLLWTSVVLTVLCGCSDNDNRGDLPGNESDLSLFPCLATPIGEQGIKTCLYSSHGTVTRPAYLLDSGLGASFSELRAYAFDELEDYWFLFWDFGDDAIYNSANSAAVNLALPCYTDHHPGDPGDVTDLSNILVRMFYHSNPGGSTYFVKIPKATFQSRCPSDFRMEDDAANLTFLRERLSFGMPDTQVDGFNLAGVEFYSGRSELIDMDLPAGLRGWNVELVQNADARDEVALNGARIAVQNGMKNIIRIDDHPRQATPNNCFSPAPRICSDWSSAVVDRIREFTVDEHLATIFVIGNEPNLENVPHAQDYADAFNFLYQAHAADIQAIETQQGIDIQILATGPSGFSETAWFDEMSHALYGVDGFAIHTYGRMVECPEPQMWCGDDRNHDRGFRYYRSLINVMDSRWYNKPVYITETNTDSDGREMFPNPAANYEGGWINRAFADVRDYNATRGLLPEVHALCWFVDRDPSPPQWEEFALSNPRPSRLKDADVDMSTEFHRRANIFN